jgi:hypothetical protein
MQWLLRTTTVACALAALACSRERNTSSNSDGGAVPSGPVLPDTVSEGSVVVYQHSANAFERAPRLRIDTTTLVAIAVDSAGTFDVESAHRVLLLGDGRTVTVDAFGSRVLVFGADGRGQRRLGREGAGPGEFMRVDDGVRLHGDTILIADGANTRFSWWLAHGEHVADRAFADSRLLGTYLTIAGALPDGRVVVFPASNGSVQATGEIVRPLVPVVVIDARSGKAVEVTQAPGREVMRVALPQMRPMVEPVRFGRLTHVAVWDSTVVIGHGDGYVIDRMRADGSAASKIRVSRPRIAVTQAMRDARMSSELQDLESSSRERRVNLEPRRILIRAAPYADSLPPYDGLHVTPDQKTLWVVDSRAPDDGGWSATAFRHDGAIIGRLVIQLNARPMAFGKDVVVLRTEDADGVASLRIHRIVAATQ